MGFQVLSIQGILPRPGILNPLPDELSEPVLEVERPGIKEPRPLDPLPEPNPGSEPSPLLDELSEPLPEPERPGMRDFQASNPLPVGVPEPLPERPGMRDFKASRPVLVPLPEPKPGSWRSSTVGVGAAMAILAKAMKTVDFILKRGN